VAWQSSSGSAETPQEVSRAPPLFINEDIVYLKINREFELPLSIVARL
tara:strand:- start:346 stop:489 length:144 start_codon:yes stop_codon:yes gene_type:complete